MNQTKFYFKDGSILSFIREPRLFRFALNKLAGFKIFAKQKQYKKNVNNSVLKKISFHFDDDHNHKSFFNAEPMNSVSAVYGTIKHK